MRVIISLPLPFDAWHVYASNIKRFCDTFKRFPPGRNYELWAMCNWGDPTDEVRQWFYGIKTVFMPYDEHGCDLGGHQSVAKLHPNALVIGMTSRCYFHRSGWIDRLITAVEKHNDAGLFGCSASKQGGKLHLCTRAFAMIGQVWNQYPEIIDSRQKGPFFEVGTNNANGNLMEWIGSLGLKSVVVHWDQEFILPEMWEDYTKCQNRFRDGNQEQMLVHDYHTDLFKNGNSEYRSEMNSMLVG